MKACFRCGEDIGAKRIAAMPETRLCLRCKSRSDEPRLNSGAKCLEKSLAMGSLSDSDEMFREAHQIASGE
jgi:RNA polymerase-binding transcription factor DksA